MKPFFIIWNPTHPYPPKVRFDSYEQAAKVAERMAEQNVGEEFYVLETVARATVKPAVVEFSRSRR